MAVECTANNLAELAKCFTGLSPAQQQAIATYLLCQIANNGGGGAAQTPWTSDIDGGCFNLDNVCKFNGIQVYRALITQTEPNAPVATVLENTLGGTPVWGYTGPGNYFLTLAGAFPADRTFITVATPVHGTESYYGLVQDVNTIVVENGLGAGGNALINTAFEILVYPATPQCPDCAA